MSRRMYRVNEAIKEVVSQEIETLNDPRIGFVTVTGVETAADLRQAKVFVSVMGDEKTRQATLEGLEATHGHLQAQLAGQLVLKRTPKLLFIYDQTIDEGLHINRLIDREAEEIARRRELAEQESEAGSEQDPQSSAPQAPGGEEAT